MFRAAIYVSDITRTVEWSPQCLAKDHSYDKILPNRRYFSYKNDGNEVNLSKTISKSDISTDIKYMIYLIPFTRLKEDQRKRVNTQDTKFVRECHLRDA